MIVGNETVSITKDEFLRELFNAYEAGYKCASEITSLAASEGFKETMATFKSFAKQQCGFEKGGD